MTPLPRSSLRAVGERRPATSPSPACSPCRAPSVTASPTTAPRSTAAFTGAPPAAMHDHLLQLRRRGVALVLEELVASRARSPRRPPARRRRRRARSPPSASVVATDATLLDAPGDRGRGAAQAVERELVAVADAHEQRGLARSRPPVGTASVSPGLPSKPASSMNAASPPSSAASTTSAPGPSSPPVATGTASRSATTRSAAVVETVNERDTVAPEWSWRRFRVVVGARTGRNVALLPAGERVARGRRAG